MGKPSELFFRTALADLRLSASEVVVVGDDIATDIFGAQNMGMRSVLVKTGNFRPGQLESPVAKPTWVVASVPELAALF